MYSEDWEVFIEQFDQNGDRLIDYEEFKDMMMTFHENFCSEINT